MTEKDPYIGETFLSKDSRTDNRRIRVTRHNSAERLGYAYYTAVVVTDDGNPRAVGRYVKLRPSTLDTRYRKVSH